MWLLPSRDRPTSMIRFFKAWRDTEASTRGILCLDDDDYIKHRAAYDALDMPPGWSKEVRTRYKSLGDNTNAYFWDYRQESFYGLLADDAVPITKHWDRKLIEAAGNDGIACCFDGINNGTGLGSSPCIGGDFVRRNGWIIYPGLARIYGDNILFESAEKLGRLKYLPDVVVEHWHFSTGKSPMDETYKKADTNQADLYIYETWKASQS